MHSIDQPVEPLSFSAFLREDFEDPLSGCLLRGRWSWYVGGGDPIPSEVTSERLLLLFMRNHQLDHFLAEHFSWLECAGAQHAARISPPGDQRRAAEAKQAPGKRCHCLVVKGQEATLSRGYAQQTFWQFLLGRLERELSIIRGSDAFGQYQKTWSDASSISWRIGSIVMTHRNHPEDVIAMSEKLAELSPLTCNIQAIWGGGFMAWWLKASLKRHQPCTIKTIRGTGAI